MGDKKRIQEILCLCFNYGSPCRLHFGRGGHETKITIIKTGSIERLVEHDRLCYSIHGLAPIRTTR